MFLKKHDSENNKINCFNNNDDDNNNGSNNNDNNNNI